MTKETISEIEALKTLLSVGPDHVVLAGMSGFVADRLMALDADQLCGSTVSVAAIAAVGVNTDGRREVPGVAVQPSGVSS